jgi:16S rRNA processing protein RimM
MNYTQIGKIVAAHGLKGDVILVHQLGKQSNLKGVTAIYLEDENKNLIPWFIEKASAKSVDEIILKLEDIHSRESAKAVYPKNVWLTEADFNKIVSKNAPIALLGFVVEEKGKVIGVVQEVIEQPHQILCTVIYQGKEVYIPLHEDSLIKIDRKAKKILVNLPDGLLDIYIS